MSFRKWVEKLRANGKLTETKKPLSRSSLDPLADPETRKSTKVGFDATKPLNVKGKNFEPETRCA